MCPNGKLPRGNGNSRVGIGGITSASRPVLQNGSCATIAGSVRHHLKLTVLTARKGKRAGLFDRSSKVRIAGCVYHHLRCGCRNNRKRSGSGIVFASKIAVARLISVAIGIGGGKIGGVTKIVGTKRSKCGNTGLLKNSGITVRLATSTGKRKCR